MREKPSRADMAADRQLAFSYGSVTEGGALSVLFAVRE
jgi:hypothetical protein